MSSWTTPDHVRAETERLWMRGQLLAAVLRRLEGQGRLHAMNPADPPQGGTVSTHKPPIVFPHPLRLRRPRAGELGPSFEAVRAWVRSLEAASRAEIGAGYDIEWEEINTRQLGRNRMPAALTLPTLDDALAVIGRRSDADRFADLAIATLSSFPALAKWIARKPLALLEHHDDWAQILDVLAWFAAHPRSGLYVRQIDVSGVDTKFIEARKALLCELLDLVLLSSAIEPSAVGTSGFEVRYGLATKPALVRFRVLDVKQAISSLTDLTVRASEFGTLGLPVKRVFIVENEVTGLAFPARENSMLIFGGGYAVERRAPAGWLRSMPIIYWGDIDTHGFAILDRLRAIFPHTQSLMMDRATLFAHRAQWSFEAAPHIGDLPNLHAEERALYDDIRFARFGSGVRLEQERVLFSYAVSAVSAHKAVADPGVD